MNEDKRPVLELRSAAAAEVNFPDRTITLLAVPYESPTPTDRPVLYRGRPHTEVFRRFAFRGLDQRVARSLQDEKPILVNREHRRGDTVGRVVRADPESVEGLVIDIRVAKTPRGDETLALADERMVWPSVGFGVRNSDQEIDRSTSPYPTRYVRRAFLDHVGMVEDPAYTRVDVLSVRDAEDFVNAADLPQLNTPLLDEWSAYVAARRAGTAA